MIPIATFRKDDKPNGELFRLLWEPRTGVVWTRRNFGEPPRSWPTFHFAKRRFAVDAMIADVYGGRFPKTFKPIPRRDRPTAKPNRRANLVSAPVGRDGTAQPPDKKEPR
ncbi:MAG: hypothetical protein IJE77_00690 [Thermoguttaceae bacterium]|nr:hypothetical protein [Thermoguttaceae bacterium]